MINRMMRDTVVTGTARKAEMPGYMPAGKTGTSQDFRDAWFVGYTGHLVTGVWIGNDDNSPMNKATGGGLPVDIWARFMKDAHKGLPILAPPVLAPSIAAPRMPEIFPRSAPPDIHSTAPVATIAPPPPPAPQAQVSAPARQSTRQLVDRPTVQPKMTATPTPSLFAVSAPTTATRRRLQSLHRAPSAMPLRRENCRPLRP